jgi:hypothetical protein
MATTYDAIVCYSDRAIQGALNTVNSFNGISGSTLSPGCLADGIPFTGPGGWYWWLRGMRRSASEAGVR